MRSQGLKLLMVSAVQLFLNQPVLLRKMGDHWGAGIQPEDGGVGGDKRDSREDVDLAYLERASEADKYSYRGSLMQGLT